MARPLALFVFVLSLLAIPAVLMFAGPLVSLLGLTSGPAVLFFLVSPLLGLFASFAYLERS